MTYTLTQNNAVLARASTLQGIWHVAVTFCGHMTIAAFTELGYAIQSSEAADGQK